jgi:hypothetical protein
MPPQKVMHMHPTTNVRHLYVTRAGWFVAWASLGSVCALGLVSLGLLAVLPAGIAAGALTASRTARRSAWGLLSGAGLLFLYIAYVQRDGPGTTCWQSGTTSGCSEHLDPLPWLIIGGTLVILGVASQAIATFLERHQGPPNRELVPMTAPMRPAAAVLWIIAAAVPTGLLTILVYAKLMSGDLLAYLLMVVLAVAAVASFRKTRAALGLPPSLRYPSAPRHG